jgi:hypothetical protein
MAVEKLLDKALLDPDLAAQLLEEGNPANRAALDRKGQGIYPQRRQKDDSVKAAIMRLAAEPRPS